MKTPLHISNLRKNIDEISNLIKIHQTCAGKRPGRKYRVEVLHKAAVVLLVAAWEAFIEDLASAGFSAILDNAVSPQIFTRKVLGLVTKGLISSGDNTRPWDLANDGWKDILKEYRDDVLEQYVGKLNTPRPSQIDGLFEKLIGLRNISRTWEWPGITNVRVLTKLEDLVTLRGEIAHRVSVQQSVIKLYVLNSTELIFRMAAISSNRVRDLIRKRTGVYPWNIYVRGKTS